MTPAPWPDPLEPPDPARVGQALADFWQTLARLPDLINRDERLLAERTTAQLREIVLELMLAMNGIRPPAGTAHLNGYLGESQRRALEKTLVALTTSASAWIGRAVACVTIYRWYAPQIVARFGADYPAEMEEAVLAQVRAALPAWPATIETEDERGERL
jgi:hypothetical protein